MFIFIIRITYSIHNINSKNIDSTQHVGQFIITNKIRYFNKTDQLKDHGYSKIIIIRLRNKTYLDELRDKAADRTEWQCLVEKLGETTGEVDDSDESTTEAKD